MRLRAGRKSFLPLLFGLVTFAHSAQTGDYRGSSFHSIRSAVFADPYTELPTYKVSRSDFGPSGSKPGNRVYTAGLRTLQSRADLHEFAGGQKLFQANGICFAGEWVIDGDSPWPGLLARGTRVPVIARASVSLDGTRRKHKRAFGMALKLFPAQDPDTLVETINLFVMHSLGGVRTAHVLDLAIDNAPQLGSLPPFGKWGTALRLQRDLERADIEVSGEANEAYRPVAQLGGGEGPRWLRLVADPDLPRVDADDFRDELQVERYPGGEVRWVIAVADGPAGEKDSAEWTAIGEVRFSESVVSESCDRRLHFGHPGLG